jgi:hypothetical protein
MDRRQRIDHYIQRLSDKNFEIYDVRKELESNNVAEEEIKIIVRAVDTELQNRLMASRRKDHSADFIRIGAVLMFIGAAITITTYTGIVDTRNFFIIAYGPFFGGLSILLVGLVKRKRKHSNNLSLKHKNDLQEKKNIAFRSRSRS